MLGKKKLRQQLILARAELSQQQKTEESAAICRLLHEHIQANGYKSIAAFLPLAEEVQLWPLFERRPDTCEIWVPRVSKDEKGEPTMYWGLLPSGLKQAPADWPVSKSGIVEPPPETCLANIIPDFVIVPCVGINLSGERIGYGGGYYDRFMNRLEDVPHAVVAFSKQIIDHNIEQNNYDFNYGKIACIDGIIECAA